MNEISHLKLTSLQTVMIFKAEVCASSGVPLGRFFVCGQEI